MAEMMLMGIDDESLKPALEALLLVSVDPVSAAELARFVGVSAGECASALAELAVEYQEQNRGFQLREVAGGWRLYTHPAFHELVEGYVLSWDTRKLSQAALETLAVIAYHQPATRDAVRAVRGVNSDGVISSLVDKGLVREVGRTKEQGAAIMYGTTTAFLEKFGLRSIKDLPPLEDFAPDEESRQFIRERLSTRPQMPAEALEEIDENQMELDLQEEGYSSEADLQSPEKDEHTEASAQPPVEQVEALPDDEEPVDLGDDEPTFLFEDDSSDDEDEDEGAEDDGESPEITDEDDEDEAASGKVSDILDDVYGKDDEDELW